jgi:hypothetical protein
MIELVAAALVLTLLTLGVVLLFRMWLEHERRKTDEIKRRERLRVLLRREDWRKGRQP